MLNEKRIKLLIIVTLIVTESFVWTVNGAADSISLGIIGSSDGPTSIYIGRSGDSSANEENAGGKTDHLQEEGQSAGQAGRDTDGPTDEERERAAELKAAEAAGLLILVNKQHPIAKDYKPDDLEKMVDLAPGRAEETRYMRAEAADAFHIMVEKAAQDGIEIKMTTAYRSYDFQKLLYDSYVAKEGEEKANTYSAKPGQSEHQTGLAVDVSSPDVDYQLSKDFGGTKAGKWLADHADQFGFILRFPEGKEEFTGYQYEPWHLRYVGLLAAKEIHDQDLTLEEYLKENGIE